MLSKEQFNTLGRICFVLGFISIIGSILIWYLVRSEGSAEATAHAERFGIFVGLWAPTFFVLSGRFLGYAEKAGD